MTQETQKLIDALSADWVEAPKIQELMGWGSPHSVRGAISQLRHKHPIERQRVNGITSYRIVDQYKPRDDFSKSIEAAYDAIKERKAAGGPGWDPQ